MSLDNPLGNQAILSEWDGNAWASYPFDSFTAFYDGWPPIAVTEDSLYFGNNSLLTGAKTVSLVNSIPSYSLKGKVSPLVSRFFLGAVPPLEVAGDRATLYFRENPSEPTNGVIPNHVHRIDRTTDFETWETLGYRYAGETGGIDFTDAAAPADSAFYRAVPQ